MTTIANLSVGSSGSSPAAPDSASRGIITQIHIAARNPLPAVIGALLGALVPSATLVVGHYELTSWTEPKALIVLGALALDAAGTIGGWCGSTSARSPDPYRGIGVAAIARRRARRNPETSQVARRADLAVSFPRA